MITGVPLEVTDVELVEASGAKTARRIVKRLGGVQVITRAVTLAYPREEEIPDVVCIGYSRFNVKDFFPRPLRCYNCLWPHFRSLSPDTPAMPRLQRIACIQ